MSSIHSEFVVQYGYRCSKDSDEIHWDDEPHAGRYAFEDGDDVAKDLALGAAKTYAAYCDYLESSESPEFIMTHRVVHRIASDLVV